MILTRPEPASGRPARQKAAYFVRQAAAQAYLDEQQPAHHLQRRRAALSRIVGVLAGSGRLLSYLFLYLFWDKASWKRELKDRSTGATR